jgi:hypothetical protein
VDGYWWHCELRGLWWVGLVGGFAVVLRRCVWWCFSLAEWRYGSVYMGWVLPDWID